MLSNRIATIGVLLLLIARPADMAKLWRGITPLQSTAKDAVKQWPECKETETRCQFTVEDQQVMIIFSGSKIGDGECPQVPKGTVLAVEIAFTRPANLKNFGLRPHLPA